jgi:hypothetical protein
MALLIRLVFAAVLGLTVRHLGMMITREDGHITVNQRDYILTLTERYGLATARTPWLDPPCGPLLRQLAVLAEEERALGRTSSRSACV